ncbi:MAG: CDP-archaeol synthase, partial [Thermosphaera sp.]
MSGFSVFEEFAFWIVKYYVPVMVANGVPVLVKGSHRVDFGKEFFDGKPVFGSNKTWEGLLVGVCYAFVAGSLISIATGEEVIALLGGFAGLFALLGDLAGAFVKRRLNIKPGDPLPIIDQLDFVFSSTLLYLALRVEEVVSKPYYVLITFSIILALHVVANNIAFFMGLK